MQDTVTLAHGAGGKQTSELIEKVFKAHFSNPYFTPDDAAVLQIPAGKMAMCRQDHGRRPDRRRSRQTR